MQERFIHSTPHEAIRLHVAAAQDWEWRPMATTLYLWTDRFNERFFDQRMPEALLSFCRMDVRILAAYTLKRNPQGLLYEITFNTCCLERPLWETLETLLHEYVHLWQQNFGQHPVERNYHNLEFVARCEELGLHPHIGSGVHLRPADGPFAELLVAHGLEQPPTEADINLNPRGKPLDWWIGPGDRERKLDLEQVVLRLPERACGHEGVLCLLHALWARLHQSGGRPGDEPRRQWGRGS